MEGPNEKRGGGRTPVGLLVRLQYGTVDEFVASFAVNISRGGIFIRSRDPKPVGTPHDSTGSQECSPAGPDTSGLARQLFSVTM